MNTHPLVRASGRLLLAAALYATAGRANGERRPRLGSQQAKALWDQCRAKRKGGNHRGSLALVHRLLRSFPDSHIYLEFEAENYGLLGDARSEAAAWELYMQVAPFPTTACPQLGRAYSRLGFSDKAFEAHRRCLSLYPSNPDLMLYYALALQGRDRPDEAEKLYREILADYPGYHDAAIGLGRNLLRRDRLAEAEEILGPVVEKAKTNPDALLAGAELAEKKGNRPLAKERLRAAIALSPSYADLYRVLGRLCERDGDREGARRAYEALVKLEPGDADAAARLKEPPPR